MPTKLAAAKINQTLEQLQRRIIERFPEAGLGRLCTDLVDTGAQTHARVRDLTKPNIKLWGGVGILLLIGLGIVGYFFSHVHFVDIWSGDFADLAQALEALVNLLVIGGAAIWFLLTLDARQKRVYVLQQLHELRSFAHVIDMHQLTKDPMSRHKRDTPLFAGAIHDAVRIVPLSRLLHGNAIPHRQTRGPLWRSCARYRSDPCGE